MPVSQELLHFLTLPACLNSTVGTFWWALWCHFQQLIASTEVGSGIHVDNLSIFSFENIFVFVFVFLSEWLWLHGCIFLCCFLFVFI